MGAPRIVEINSVESAVIESSRGSIALVDIPEGEKVIQLVCDQKFSHVVQKQSIGYDSEILAARSMILNPAGFFEQPVDVILGLGDAAANLPSLVVKSAMDEKKTKTLSEFEAFVEALPGSRTIRDSAQLIADELYTNGAKNGFSPPRLKDSVVVRPGTVELFAKSDGERLVFGVRDSYGLLKPHQVLGRIKRCYENGIAASINHGDGGAGIGSFMVFSNSISYYCGVDPDKTTIVCVALPLGRSRKESDGLPKNIHLISR